MITQQIILDYVDQQAPTPTKNTFYLVLDSKNPTNHKAAIQLATTSIQEVRNDETISASIDDYLKNIELETLLSYVTHWSLQQRKSLKHQLFVKPFIGFWLRLLCYAYGLNSAYISKLRKEESEAYYEIGDGLWLAGLYLYLGA